jgi:hypothetical protein
MTDDLVMRMRLQQVAAYRALRRAVRRTGRENVFFAMVMLGLAYYAFNLGVGKPINLLVLVYVGLALGELAVGLFKTVFPSAEGILLDAIVLLLFAGFNLGVQALNLQAKQQMSNVGVFLGLFMLWAAAGQFRRYLQMRKLFADRPSAEHVAWFDDLIGEIRAADPELDDQAIDLPTRPHWKVKLIGPLAFFTTSRGETVWVAGPGEFEIVRDAKDDGHGRRRARLNTGGQLYPPFDITDASWANYQKWLKANAALPPRA